jgi:hypothetical protein
MNHHPVAEWMRMIEVKRFKAAPRHTEGELRL